MATHRLVKGFQEIPQLLIHDFRCGVFLLVASSDAFRSAGSMVAVSE